jgi:predicted ATPase/DNA-binding CsgD family transcriptional regulator
VGISRVELRQSGSALGWLTPLVGREAELAEVERLLQHNRLLTITGMGGVGKTRLALELASGGRGDEADEPVLVELAPLEPPAAERSRLEPVASAIWRTLAVTAPPGGAPADAICHRFADRPVLLVLDNCEHLEAVAPVVELLLRRCPAVRVLATSRRPLALAGETVWQLAPLSVPQTGAPDTLAAVLDSEAGRLFSERARRSRPSFSITPAWAPAVAEICHRLDGLPLALELAAARVRILTPPQILEGLADRFRLLSAGPPTTLGRHRTLTASLDWSYELIGDDARLLLRRLAVGHDWSLEAVQAVWGPRGSPLDALDGLADAGLLVIVELGQTHRYRLLESVRSYALWRLREAGEEDDVRRVHLDHFRALAADADRLLEDDVGRRTLELEARSLYDALAFAAANQPAVALAMAADLRHWLLVAGNPAEPRALCVRVLATAPAGDPAARAHLLFTAALLAIFDEDYEPARAYAEEALPLAQASGDESAIGIGVMLASVAQRSQDPSASAQLGERAVGLLRQAGDRHGLALAVAQLAMTEALRDRFAAVRSACEDFASLTEGQPPSWLAVWLEIALAWADLAQGDPESALAHADRGLALEDGRPTLGHYMALSYELHARTLMGDAGHARAAGMAAIEQAHGAGFGVAVSAVEHALGFAELALDELESVRTRALARFGDPHFAAAAGAHELLARIELAEQRAAPLARHGAALRATGQHIGSPRLLALADWADGSADPLTGELEETANQLHEALALQIEQRLRPDAIDTLEALAELQLAAGHAETGARLLGGARRARSELMLCRLPPREAHFAELEKRGEQQLGPEGWTAAVAAGRGLALDEVLDYARRGRGHRVSSLTGLASLTPTERRVAEAAAEGLTNSAIAARLLMSHGTVKAHLAHAYKKLGAANRVQLSALVREQQPRF